MSIESKLYTLLSTDADLFARIGTKVFPIIAPQYDENGAAVGVPYCTYFLINDNLDYTHQGYSGLRNARFQIDCYDATFEKARSLARLVMKATTSWPEVQAAFVKDNKDFYESSTKFYHSIVEVVVWDGDNLGGS